MINKSRNNSVSPVKERTAFQVGRRLYKTKEAAAKTMAWSWVLSKYDTEWQHWNGGTKIQDIKKVLDFECSCGEDCNDCELHDRDRGYFRRLARKAAEYILRSWGK